MQYAEHSSSTYGVGCIDELARLAELNEALLEVVERPLHQHLLLLVVVEQVVPQRLLRQHLRVADDDHAKPTNNTTCYDISHRNEARLAVTSNLVSITTING